MFLFEEGLIPVLLLGLWVYCILDVIASDDVLMRNLPKGVWLMIVIFLPDVGSLAWLLLGRPLYAGWRPGDTTRRAPRRVIGPEDRADFAAGTVRPLAPPRPVEPRLPEPPSPPGAASAPARAACAGISVPAGPGRGAGRLEGGAAPPGG